MAKKRRTRSQKKRASLRHPISFQDPPIVKETVASESPQEKGYTFSPQAISTTPTSPITARGTNDGYAYLMHDLRKTFLLTGAIVISELILGFGLHTI